MDSEIKHWEAVSADNFFLVFDAENQQAMHSAESLLKAFIDAKNLLIKLANEKSTEVSPYYMLQEEAKHWLRVNK